jgi:glycosyltransferase involved in cell wall biosynthesis
MPYVDDLLNQLSTCMDHVYVVDTGSTDGFRDPEHINKLPSNVHVFYHEWKNNFSEARNISFSYGFSEMIFWCDCDDMLSPQLVDAINNLRKNKTVDEVPDWIDIPYLYYVENPGTEFLKMRICKRKNNPKWECAIHENVMYNIFDAVQLFPNECKILHQHRKPHTDRNLNIFHNLDINRFEFSGRDLYYYAMELYSMKWYVPSYSVACECIRHPDTYWVDRINAVMLLSTLQSEMKYTPSVSPWNMAEICKDQFGAVRQDLLAIIGRHYLEIKDWWKVIGIYNQALQLKDPGSGFESFLYDRRFTKIEPYIQISVSYYNLGNLNKAIEYINKVLEIDPNNELALFNLKCYNETKIKNS